ncbi:MAG: universal stress protein [Verrucomicrobia bacterium]|nr:MAG: universal stress protein [Verrucomicrobiota bacterium]
MPSKKTTAAGGSGVKVVVSGKGGHGHATVPLLELSPMRFHIARILVPVDFSEPSRKALHYAKLFAQQFEASLVLIHAVEPLAYPPDFAVVPLLPPDVEEARTRELESQLAELASNVGGGVKTEAVVRNGRAWQEVVEYAKTGKVDLIIVSTHGYTGLKHALLGSVAEKIVRHAPCPVLVVRDEEHDFA